MDNIHHEFLEWVDKFLKLEVWKDISDEQIFCIQHASWKEPAFISIMGNSGISFGVSIWKGIKSYVLLNGLLCGDIDNDTAFTEGDIVSIYKCKSSQIPPQFKEYLIKAGYENIKNNELPEIYTIPPYKIARTLNEDEAEYILYCIKAIMTVYKEGRLSPDRFKKDSPLLAFFVKGDKEDMTIEEGYVPYVLHTKLSKEIELSREEYNTLRSLGGNNSTYLISYFVAPFSVQGRLPRTLLVYDQEVDAPIFVEASESTEPFENINKKLISVFKGNNLARKQGLPKQIITDSKHFYDCAKKYLAGFGVEMICSERVEKLEQIKKDFKNYMSKPRR